MFVVVRSVFWLTVAYMVIKPGVDLPDANALSQQAMAAGSAAIASHIDSIDCDSFQCFGGKAIATHTLSSIAAPALPPVALPMHETATARLAPVPRPRPAWAG
ncbi:hypothetical protein SAMN05428969_0853 [Devosia sp. YR412]|uniref:hypothetical protein n=1 Tax=Devosia sp. YR412 TaxID=1881030 RepID=UPI0008C22B4C|nr:hypothetical protein [Devosia sp. YR412]SEP77575.1 hypothetical protein SAMN05428969_0853 [Devosia sp. YR412]